MTGGNIILVGVGGQGIILATKIASLALLKAGYDVKVSEIHGMAQRGGSVHGMIRFSEQVHSPIISLGEADIILGFEPLETARWLPYLKVGGELIINEQIIKPMPVLLGRIEYPADLLSLLGEKVEKITTLNASRLAIQAGGQRFTNMVMLGTLKNRIDIEENIWLEAIKESVSEKYIKMNMNAFKIGSNL